MNELAALLQRVAAAAADFRSSVGDRPVHASHDLDQLRVAFGRPLDDRPTAAADVIDELIAAAEGGLLATAGPRYFGFVIGGALDAATAADVLTSGWDQCAFSAALSPAATVAEEVAGSWIVDLLGLPVGSSVGFVTGGQAGNTVGLVAARHHVLNGAGWDVESDGLAGAPRVRVIASDERHATIDRSLRLLGFGHALLESVATDQNGATDMTALAEVVRRHPPGPTIVCLQAGNVNTGAIDDLRTGCSIAREHGAWVHVDGAFGLWAAASPALRHLLDGVDGADSWACDGHKWLNLPYDSGFAICAHPAVHARAISYSAAYLTGSGGAVAGRGDLTLESSRRARGFTAWAGLRQLGRSGVGDLIDGCCAHARRFADGLAAGGATIGNEVMLNQVLVSFGDDARTDDVVERVQRDGTCWMGATTWHGRRYMRIAVSNASTTAADVDRSVEAILRVASS